MTHEGGWLVDLAAAWDGRRERMPTVEAELDRDAANDAERDLRVLDEAVERDLTDLIDAPAPLGPVEAARLSGRFGWLVCTLRDWDPGHDPRGRLLDAALLCAARWDGVGDLWAVLKHLMRQPDRLCRAFDVVIGQRRPQMHVPVDAPIWEREHARSLDAADRAGDWVALEHLTTAFQRLPSPDPAATQAVRGLAALDWLSLVAASNKASSWSEAVIVTAPLRLSAAFRLAAAGSSGHVVFTVLERMIRRERRPLSTDEQDALSHLMAKAAWDSASWPKWMGMLNRHPVRNPQLQVPLGRALARSTVAAIQAYVDAVELVGSSAEGRKDVARCLAEFRGRATTARRRAAWGRAFERWAKWDFGAATGSGARSPVRSELDYPVTGWLVEFADPASLAAAGSEFDARAATLDTEWHRSITDVVSKYERSLARFHAYTFASTRTKDDPNWLFEEEVFIPPNADDAYLRSKYRSET